MLPIPQKMDVDGGAQPITFYFSQCAKGITIALQNQTGCLSVS